MRKTNNKRRDYEKTLYHKYPIKIAANSGLFPCQTVDKGVQCSSKHPRESKLYK